METQKHMGRGQLVDRLTAQVRDRGFAIALLKKRGDMNPGGTLTAKGEARNRMTAEERALDRAGETAASATYNPETNRVTKNK
ncbi:MAG: hypothetical protein GY787_23585 [Alteromonadales bacterium]|nr:hypothetical protein [Alteromonadales bacterium]